MSQDANATPMSAEEIKTKTEELLEVRPVEPIKLDTVETTTEVPEPAPKLTDIARPKKKTPQELILSLQADLLKERTHSLGLARDVDAARLERDNTKAALELVGRDVEEAREGVGRIAAERDAWKAKAQRAETQVDGQRAERLVALIGERDRLRNEVRNKDAALADRQQLLEKCRQAVREEEGRSRAAEQRFQGLEATAQTMQIARDTAIRERAEAQKNYEGACKTIADMHAAAVGAITGPKRGVVEDVKAVREERDRLKTQNESLLARLTPTASTPVPARKGA